MATESVTVTKEAIKAFLWELIALERYDVDQGYHYFEGDPEWGSTTCTTSAYRIAARFGGEVWGVASIDPGAAQYKGRVASRCGGHDFAIVGDYLVDWWAVRVACMTPGHPGMLHLVDDAEQIKIWYGPRERWKRLEFDEHWAAIREMYTMYTKLTIGSGDQTS